MCSLCITLAFPANQGRISKTLGSGHLLKEAWPQEQKKETGEHVFTFATERNAGAAQRSLVTCFSPKIALVHTVCGKWQVYTCSKHRLQSP